MTKPKLANPWDADRVLTAAGATRAIGSAVPALAGQPAVLLGSGWDFDAYEVASRDGDLTWVFKFPRRAAEVGRLQTELEVLALVAGRLPLAVPQYAWPLLTGTGFPHAFSGYEKIAGRPLLGLGPTATRCAAMVPETAAFLQALHAIDGTGLSSVSVGRSMELGAYRLQRGAFVQNLGAWAPPALLPRLEAWWADPSVVPAEPLGKPRLIHEDIHAEHALLDTETLLQPSGVIDWGDAALGDPAADFMGYTIWGGLAFLDALLQAYHERGGDVGDVAALRERIVFGATMFGCVDAECFHRLGQPEHLAAVLAVLETLVPPA